MADTSRIDELRRRVQKDPASIAFAQLAEELRRAGAFKEAVEVARAGLNRHPGYVSARVTLGRALVDLNDLDNAEAELRLVLKTTPDNLSAIRGRGDIFRRRGDLEGALAQYRVALGLAHNDPDLERVVNDLSQQLGVNLMPPATTAKSAKAAPAKPTPARAAPATLNPAKATRPTAGPTPLSSKTAPSVPESAKPDPLRERALRTIAALERFLDAVHVARARQHA